MDPIHFQFLVTFPAVPLQAQEVTSSSPDGECVVGDAFDVAARFYAGPLACSVLSAPEGSAATFQGGRFVPDVPGVYVFSLSNGGATIKHRRVAFPREALDHPGVADRSFPRRAAYSVVAAEPRTDVERRLVLRRIAAGGHAPIDVGGSNHDRKFPASAFDALTPSRPLPDGLDFRNM